LRRPKFPPASRGKVKKRSIKEMLCIPFVLFSLNKLLHDFGQAMRRPKFPLASCGKVQKRSIKEMHRISFMLLFL